MAVIDEINSKISSSLTSIDFLNVLGWIAFIILFAVASWFLYNYYKNKKVYNKRITAFEIINGYWQPVIRDVARTVKLGKGGFEILLLKKLNTWKIAYGGRVGKSDYYFFIMPDGYWYNGMLYGDVCKLEENKGLVPIVTTNPLMRGQYTALEKNIEALHGEKKKFWDKYGNWVLSISFVLISGVMLWLMFKEYNSAMGQISSAISSIGEYNEQLTKLLEQVNSLLSNAQQSVQASNLNVIN